jgi:hypothetical protein
VLRIFIVGRRGTRSRSSWNVERVVVIHMIWTNCGVVAVAVAVAVAIIAVAVAFLLLLVVMPISSHVRSIGELGLDGSRLLQGRAWQALLAAFAQVGEVVLRGIDLFLVFFLLLLVLRLAWINWVPAILAFLRNPSMDQQWKKYIFMDFNLKLSLSNYIYHGRGVNVVSIERAPDRNDSRHERCTTTSHTLNNRNTQRADPVL